MDRFLELTLICLLVGLFSVNEGLAQKTPIYIKELLADANKTSSFPYKEPAQNSIYDYLIVGAGPAGCALANRLSANPNISVYLLEAGGPERMAHAMPVLANGLLGTKTNYGYKTVPQKYSCFGMNDNRCDAAQGKSLGGSSSFSNMIINRGDRKTFDEWAAAGNPGWAYDDVLTYFLRAENSSLFNYQNSRYHNYSGSYISSEDVKYRTPISSAFVQACDEAALNSIDYNNPDTKIGYSYLQASSLNGRRHSAFKAYIELVQADRPNLHVLPYSLVSKVLIDSETNTAYGVDFEHFGKKFTIFANKEVILSAGPFHSPQLLIVSGIGPSETLNEIGVPEIVDLPVGETLYDHVGFFGPVFRINTTMATLFIDRISQNSIARFRHGDPSTIVSTISGFEASAFIKTKFSKEDGPYPDIELMMVASSFAVDFGTTYKTSLNMRDDVYNKTFKSNEGKEHFGIIITPYYPKSKGSLSVVSSDIRVPPSINPNYYSKKRDVELILEGIKAVLEIASLPGMQAINATLVTNKVPGCDHLEFGTDDYWRCAIRVVTLARHHYTATCKMGPVSDRTAVVDSNLKVYGVEGLRVVDTSVIPFAIAAHTEAIAYMIGEKASDIIIDTWNA